MLEFQKKKKIDAIKIIFSDVKRQVGKSLDLYAITLQSNIPKTLKASPFLKVSNDKKKRLVG